jgi:hypothetical protein
MPSDKEARQAKADRLKKQIEELKAPLKVDEGTTEPDIGTPEMLPGESPHAYIERRTREIERKRRLALREEQEEQ